MKPTFILAALALCAGPGALADEATHPNSMAVAQQSATTTTETGKFGAGIIIGEPTGASLKYWLNDTAAIDGGLGWSLRDTGNFYLYADYLWHNFDLIPVSNGRAPVYFGVGPSLKFRNHGDDLFGARFPIGASYMFDNRPLDVFVEFAPTLDLAPFVRSDFNLGFGVRYWF